MKQYETWLISCGRPSKNFCTGNFLLPPGRSLDACKAIRALDASNPTTGRLSFSLAVAKGIGSGRSNTVKARGALEAGEATALLLLLRVWTLDMYTLKKCRQFPALP